MTQFSSPKLQNAFNKAKPILENISNIQDLVSKDITALEDFLKTLFLSESFFFQISSPCNNYESTEEGNFANEELLIWDSEKKRLMFQHKMYCASISTGEMVCYNADSEQILQYKPLIETKFQIRKHIYEYHLSNFLSELSEKYGLTDANAFSDMPF